MAEFWFLFFFISGLITGTEYGQRQPIECTSIGWGTPEQQMEEVLTMVQTSDICEGKNESSLIQ